MLFPSNVTRFLLRILKLLALLVCKSQYVFAINLKKVITIDWPFRYVFFTIYWIAFYQSTFEWHFTNSQVYANNKRYTAHQGLFKVGLVYYENRDSYWSWIFHWILLSSYQCVVVWLYTKVLINRCYFIFLCYLIIENRELKQLRRRPQRRLQKNNRFND